MENVTITFWYFYNEIKIKTSNGLILINNTATFQSINSKDFDSSIIEEVNSLIKKEEYHLSSSANQWDMVWDLKTEISNDLLEKLKEVGIFKSHNK